MTLLSILLSILLSVCFLLLSVCFLLLSIGGFAIKSFDSDVKLSYLRDGR